MSTLLNINIWKKEANRFTSMPDYQIDVKEGDSYKIGELIEAIKKGHEISSLLIESQKRTQEECKIKKGRWVSLRLQGNEILKCFSCDKNLRGQKVYLYLHANDRLSDVLCGTCWREKVE